MMQTYCISVRRIIRFTRPQAEQKSWYDRSGNHHGPSRTAYRTKGREDDTKVSIGESSLEMNSIK